MWARIDDQFYLNPKNATIDRDEQDLFLAGNVYCNLNLTDGFIPAGALPQLLVWAKIPIEANPQAIASAIASRLLDHGYWEPTPGGYQVHDFLDWNICKADAEKLSEARSEAGKRGGRRSAEVRQAKAQAKAEAIAQAKPKQSATPIPIPNHSLLTTTTAAQAGKEAFVSAGLTDFSNCISDIKTKFQSDEICDRLEEIYERRLFNWWGLALKAACDNNGRTWAYVRTTIDNCLKAGTPPGAPRPQTNGNGRSGNYGQQRNTGSIASEANRIENERLAAIPANRTPRTRPPSDGSGEGVPGL